MTTPQPATSNITSEGRATGGLDPKTATLEQCIAGIDILCERFVFNGFKNTGKTLTTIQPLVGEKGFSIDIAVIDGSLSATRHAHILLGMLLGKMPANKLSMGTGFEITQDMNQAVCARDLPTIAKAINNVATTRNSRVAAELLGQLSAMSEGRSY